MNPEHLDMHLQSEDFDKTVENRLNKTRELLLVKGKEYVRGNNRFHNFDRAAAMNNSKPTRELHGMLTKHLVSYLDMLDDIDKGFYIKQEVIEEKFGDIMVYFLLQEAMISHRYCQRAVYPEKQPLVGVVGTSSDTTYIHTTHEGLKEIKPLSIIKRADD